MTGSRAAHLRMAANGVLLTAAVVLGWIAVNRRSPMDTELSRGSEFPALMLTDSNGDTVHAGTPSGDRLVVFFSTECEYCIRSMPVYRRISEMCDLSLILAFTDLSGKAVLEWWKENRQGFSHECSPVTIGGLASALPQYGVTATPTHYLVSSDGTVQHRFVGMLGEVPSWVDRKTRSPICG